MTPKIKTILIDDHQFVLDGMKHILIDSNRIEVIAEANSIKDARLKLIEFQDEIDVIVCDLHLPDGNGIELIKWADEHLPEAKVLVLTMNDEPDVIKNVLDANANGYLIKTSPAAELLKAIYQVNEGLIYYGNRVRELLNQNHVQTIEIQSATPFSEREIEVLQLIAEEHSSIEIGEKLFISHYTVDTHRKNMLRKINARSIVSLVRYGIRQQLIRA